MPHRELRHEFQENVKQLFWMYRPESFLEYAKDKFKLDINPRSIEETNQIADTESADKPDTTLLGKTIEQNKQQSKNLSEIMQNINLDRVIEQNKQQSKNLSEIVQNINWDKVIEQHKQQSKNLSETMRYDE
ncbi:hypothetical protein [Dapis sp. BLCC M172]|uniref:hypothetical protein n=1 Tax=Dapis sp. BLCC M172 TaxID=2975281 RepID=UPI003CF97BAD